MRIALVIERMDPSKGGRETSTAQMAQRLVGLGQDVTVLCQTAAWSAEGVTVRPLGVRPGSRRAQLAGFCRDVQAASAEGGFDIVHASLPVRGANVYQLRGGTIPGQRMAAVRRRGRSRWLARAKLELNPVRRLLGRMEAELLADPSVACLPVSQQVAEEMQHYYGRRDNVHVVHNGVDLPDVPDDIRRRQRQELRAAWNAAESETVFITAARNLKLKGVDWAARAVAELDRPARLVVVGPAEGRLQRLVRRLGASERVVLAGPADDIHPYYAAGDACVLLSWYDPCSRVVLEATRWAVPSITTSLNGAGEVLADGAGLVVDRPDSLKDVVAAMRLLCDVSWREEAAQRCRQVAPELSMDRHVRQLVEVYEQVRRR